jgi:hypothetical protein
MRDGLPYRMTLQLPSHSQVLAIADLQTEKGTRPGGGPERVTEIPRVDRH